MNRRLVLIFVAFHSSEEQVSCLRTCLERLTEGIGYALVVNDHRPGEPIEALFDQADLVVCNEENIGYGRAINCAAARLSDNVPYIAALNTDLVWEPGTFERIISWLDQQPNSVLVVPRILNPAGQEQLLCKHDPTVLALLSRRFIPRFLKPTWLRKYDRWFSMLDADYDSVMHVCYLSGCCMVFRHQAFRLVGGFDQRFFLYLEDADITRKLRHAGDTLHVPFASVVHAWGRGNYTSLWLTLVNLMSAIVYFSKWGFRLF